MQQAADGPLATGLHVANVKARSAKAWSGLGTLPGIQPGTSVDIRAGGRPPGGIRFFIMTVAWACGCTAMVDTPSLALLALPQDCNCRQRLSRFLWCSTCRMAATPIIKPYFMRQNLLAFRFWFTEPCEASQIRG